MSIALQIAPNLDLLKVQKRAIITMPTWYATLEAHMGLPVTAIPLQHRDLQRSLQESGEKFIERMRIRGFTYIDLDDMHVYGPHESKMLHESMVPMDTAHLPPEEVRNLVQDKQYQVGEFVDYLLVANFLRQEVITEVVTDGEQQPDSLS